MKTMDKVLIFLFTIMLVFVAVMIWIFYEKKEIPDTLCTCFFSFIGGECGVMGWIKTTKEKQKEHDWQKEDEKSKQHESNNQQEA